MTTQDSFDNQNPPPLAQPAPQASLAPPTSPAPLAPPRESRWPAALGLITIVLGIFYILGAFSQVSSVFQLTSAHRADQSPERAAMQLPLPWQITATVVSLILALLILVCGIMLLERKRAAVAGLKVWAVAYVLIAVVNLAMRYTTTTAAIMQRAQQNATASGAPRGLVAGAMFAGMCFSSLFALALPVFMLILFSRRKIKDEVATWS